MKSTEEKKDTEKRESVAKTFSEVVEKFNPFHDGRGRFSTSQGMASYSANPNTKAGQMAIQRSTAAGYGGVMNVHRESKGENIRQNDLWISTKRKPTPSQLARAQANAPKSVAQMRQNAHTNRVKGTMGATETATARHPANPNRKQTQQNQQQQNQQNQQQTAQQSKPQQKPQQNNQQGIKDSTAQYKSINKFQGETEGKDITQTFKLDPNSSKNAITQIMEAQGMNKPPKEVSAKDFDAIVTNSGQVGHRTWHEDRRGSGKAGAYFRDNLLDGKQVDAEGSGGRAYGSGIYATITKPKRSGTGGPSSVAVRASQHESNLYGYGNGKDAQVAFTVSPSTKIIGAQKARNMFAQEPVAVQRKFQMMSSGRSGDHISLWAAAKGYDGVAHQVSSNQYSYLTLFNPSKTVVMDRKVTSTYYGGGEGYVPDI